MKETTGYVHEGREEEVRRLEFQGVKSEPILEQQLHYLQLRPGMKVLDAGCGTGFITRKIARKIVPSNAYGVDFDDFFITKAKELAKNEGIENVKFEVGDITTLGFADDFFDASFCKVVLMHVRNPIKAISELKRVTRSGGLVAAVDNDDDTLIIYPEVPKARKLAHKFTEWMKEKNVDRYIGRRLFSIFKQAGLESIRIIGFPGIITGDNPEAIRKYFSNIFQSFEQIKDILIGQGIITSEEYEDAYQECQEFTKDPGACLMSSTFIGIGEVP